MDDFVIAVNPEEDSSLPYLIRLPLGRDGLVLKVRDTWPRTAKVYCHAALWPDEPEIIERIAVRTCRRRGASIDLVLDRGRENRSQVVFTRARGREMIFWQTAKVAKQARPNVTVPTARASGQILTIVVDTGERHAWTFSKQQATTVKRRLPAGDYAVETDDGVVAVVERKALSDLVSSVTSGKLRYQMSELATAPRAAVVVEDRYSSVLKTTFVRPFVVLDALAEAQVRVPEVPIVFCENRTLAQEWTYRFLGAALAHRVLDLGGLRATTDLEVAGALPHAEPTTKEIRSWAIEAGLDVSDRGRIPSTIRQAYERARRNA